MSRKRPAFTLFQLLVILAILALLFALLLPVVAKLQATAARAASQNNLKQLALACLNYETTYGTYPPGLDAKGFSTGAYVLPFIEQEALYQKIDFKKGIDDKDNKEVAAATIKVFINPRDPVDQVSKDYGPTNYLFCAGSKPDLKDNDGVLYFDSKIKTVNITDGTSQTMFAGETLKGAAAMESKDDKAAKILDVHRQQVLLKKDDLKNLKDDAGVKDFKDDKNIAADRCRSWMDGHFLQSTFTATRVLNDEKPDVDCGGVGGLSGLRSIAEGANIAMCDGSVRFVQKKLALEVWKALAGRNDGVVIPEF
jgi:prepilin-type processing-associated H-X9-DG protein